MRRNEFTRTVALVSFAGISVSGSLALLFSSSSSMAGVNIGRRLVALFVLIPISIGIYQGARRSVSGSFSLGGQCGDGFSAIFVNRASIYSLYHNSLSL